MLKHHRQTLVRGLICDLVTPFRGDAVDHDALAMLVNWQIVNGVSALAVCGRIGEGPTLSHGERRAVLSTVMRATGLAVPVLASVGTCSTEDTIRLALDAEAEGVDALIVTTPYYSKPTQKGIVTHMRSVAQATTLPILVLAEPALGKSDVTAETLLELSEISGIHGFIDASGDMARLAMIGRDLRERLALYSAHDATAFAFNVLGGIGTLSAIANLAPRTLSGLHQALATRNLDLALGLKDRLIPLVAALGDTPDPAAIKHALATRFDLAETVRLPLSTVAMGTGTKVCRALSGLLDYAGQLPKAS
jgi:4-hydroxy-tetrahydrodipicolinate synthase